MPERIVMLAFFYVLVAKIKAGRVVVIDCKLDVWRWYRLVENKVGENIYQLRLAYRETQMELAYAIGLNSPNSISNYEKGYSNPKRDILQKIAAHYRIAEEELVHGELSNLSFNKSPIDDKEKTLEMTEILFPISYTDKAYADPLFKVGYDTHMRMYESMKKGEAFNENDFDKCFNSYLESFEANGTYESVANCLWWLFITGAGINNAQLSDGVDALYKNEIDKATFLKQHYLNNCEDGMNIHNGECEDFLEDGDEVIIYLLQELNASSEGTALAQYYVAIRYLFGIIKNRYDNDTNKMIGEEMMTSLASIGNQYAERLIQKGFNNLYGE